MASGRHFPRDELVGIVWSGDDRSMTSADPAIFNPAEGGRARVVCTAAAREGASEGLESW